MKITRAEADLIEKVRQYGSDPAVLAANLDALERGFSDMKKYLCGRCSMTLDKVLLFRRVAERG